MASAPQYKELPELFPGYRCSWSYFNSLVVKEGRKDKLGTLNFLTPERRLAAAQQIRTGESISLEADISAFGGRPAPKHVLKRAAPFCHEDHIEFNTQSSSQWDGFRHFALRSNNIFYNGYAAEAFADSDVLGIQSWAQNGSITGRGVLIDFKSWAETNNISIAVNDGTRITLSHIKKVLESQNTTIQYGDILIFRTGWLHWYNTTDTQLRHDILCVQNAPGGHHFIGLDQDEALVEWLWDNQIAAVAGDQVAFEATPPPDKGFGWLHEHLLAALGCPMGELWDTERLAERCSELGRYEFFLASTPLVLPGVAASPANAVAIL
ncbi:putative cyclase-domain-containing protein [Aspergillus germanicus]